MGDLTGVRLGFVGLGNIARYHADQAASLGAQVVAGCDVSPEARSAFDESYGTDVFDDATEMWDIVDAVVVSTPNRYHEEYVVDALDAGLDVLVEKPLAHDLESAESIAAAARDAPGFCMVGFHNRFRGPVQVLNGYREAGRLGEVNHVEITYVRRRGVPGRGSWFTRKDVAGGGAVIDIGTHAIDLALHLLGYPELQEVSATTRANFGSEEDYSYLHMWGDDQGPGTFDVEDSATAFVRCANDVTFSLEVAWASNRDPRREFYLRGTDAGARIDLADDELQLYETGMEGVAHHRNVSVETNERDPHAIQLERFLRGVATGERPETNTVDEGLTVQRVIDAIYRSDEDEMAVRLD